MCDTRLVAEDHELTEVRLLRVPLRLRDRSNQHGEELLRQLALVQIGAEQHVNDSVPARLLDIAAEVQSTYGVFSSGPNDQMDAALDRGEDTMDVAYRLPRHVGPFLHRLRRILDEATEYCRQGEHLLTLAPPDDVVAYRRWVFEEFERQIAGEAPRPWQGES